MTMAKEFTCVASIRAKVTECSYRWHSHPGTQRRIRWYTCSRIQWYNVPEILRVVKLSEQGTVLLINDNRMQ